MKFHHQIINHVKKHHKKYLLGAGMAFGLGILKIMAIAGVFLGISLTTGKSNAANEELKVYKVSEMFNRINEIAKEEILEKKEENPFITEEMKKEFYQLDAEYHETENIHEEYLASKKMVDFLTELEKNRPQVTGDKETDIEKDNEYRDLLMQFYQLK